MNQRKRKAKLIEAGVKQKDLAQKLHVSEAAISQVVSGKIKSRRIEAAIGQAIGRKHTRQAPAPIKSTRNTKSNGQER